MIHLMRSVEAARDCYATRAAFFFYKIINKIENTPYQGVFSILSPGQELNPHQKLRTLLFYPIELPEDNTCIALVTTL